MAPRSSAPSRFRRGDRSIRIPIRTERLVMRLPRLSDVEDLMRLLSEPTVARGTLRIPFPYLRSDAVQYIERSPVRVLDGTDLPMVLEAREDGALVGGIGLHAISAEEADATIGYWLGLPYRGKGYATEAVCHLSDLAFGPLGLHRLEASVFPFNRASMAVLRRAGFHREGVARDAHLKNGTWMSDVRFSRLATDPPGVPEKARRRRGSPKP